MDWAATVACTPSESYGLFLAYVLPPAGALLSAIALWVASQARSTSEDARLTTAAVARRSDVAWHGPAQTAWAPDAQDRRKS
jgi:hypothetical protein